MKINALRKGLNTDEIEVLESVYKLANHCNYEAEHTNQVTHFSLNIFDDLLELHHLSYVERFYLLCAAILHDIGVHTDGPHAHHKKTLKIVLKTPILLFNQKERLIVGSVARCHRRALPSIKHDQYRALNPIERKIVSKLAGILRVADGLDYSHRQRVKDVQAAFTKNKINFLCTLGSKPAKKEMESAEKKSNLLENTFQRKVFFKTQRSA